MFDETNSADLNYLGVTPRGARFSAAEVARKATEVGRIHYAPKLDLLTKLIDEKMNWTGRKTLSNSRKIILETSRAN